jgi:hypothetical protein
MCLKVKNFSQFLFTPNKVFPKIAGSGPGGSYDFGLKFVSLPGAELIECHTHTHTHTEYEYYNIDSLLKFRTII